MRTLAKLLPIVSLVILPACINPFGPTDELEEPCVSTLWTHIEYVSPGYMVLVTDSITYEGDGPCAVIVEGS